MVIAILIVALVLFVVLSGLFYSKYKESLKINSRIDNLIKDFNKPIRSGYYVYSVSQTDTITGKIYKGEGTVYVSEIDRYTSGESKIKLNEIEIEANYNNFNKDSCKNFITENFKSIKKTAEINWLESETTIKEMRKEKLDKIKEALK